MKNIKRRENVLYIPSLTFELINSWTNRVYFAFYIYRNKYKVYIQKLFVHGENGSLEKTFYVTVFIKSHSCKIPI